MCHHEDYKVDWEKPMAQQGLYLIAHKVRGEPAFDIAIQMEMEDEVWWIIPTSGHRAYPYWYDELPEHDCPPCPDPWPDHYWQPGQTSDLDIPEEPEGRGLLAALGFVKPTEPFKRRI